MGVAKMPSNQRSKSPITLAVKAVGAGVWSVAVQRTV
jgi:hypothetical protein